MSDDERLAALFRAAAADAPPPGFDHDDVVHASRRITARRRAAAVAAAVVVGLAGAGAAITLPGAVGSDGELTSAAAPAQPLSVPEAADARAGRDDSGAETSEGAGTALAPAAPPPAPLGAGQEECADRQDPALRALLEQVLPEVVGAPPAATTFICL
ncbi:MAG TPA: hypothetical protein VEZ42_20465, partial [Pseudonocardia sp.]|nr:hypothetical protein [Pseudonocardia sp.]